MPSNNFEIIESNLEEALQSFDWGEAESICKQLVTKIYESPDLFTETKSKKLLSNLRKKRQFNSMTILGEAIISSGHIHPEIQRQYAQSLIDQGMLTAAIFVLNNIIINSSNSREYRQARGLIGRIYKQHYVQSPKGGSKRRKILLKRSLDEYLLGYGYGKVTRKNYWHGINIVALLKRGHRDKLSLEEMPDANALAEEILSFFESPPNKSDNPTCWELATSLEALIALGKNKEAIKAAIKYSDSKEADAFEINSTLRQLIEVWQLDYKKSPGLEILPILQSALLKREGGEINLTCSEAKDFKESAKKFDGFEKNFGENRAQPLKWLLEGLDRSKSVARIELANGQGIGTGWLVNGKDFSSKFDDRLFITNAHVISENPEDEGLLPEQVKANFQRANQIHELGEIVWSSPLTKLDTTFISIKDPPSIEPLPIKTTSFQMGRSKPRFYIIGHPDGRDIEFSIHDNHFVDLSEPYLHYRTPTEEGSSGSPVFDQIGWEVVALHHRGRSRMPRFDGNGTYEANEGVTMRAIKKAVENGS